MKVDLILLTTVMLILIMLASRSVSMMPLILIGLAALSVSIGAINLAWK